MFVEKIKLLEKLVKFSCIVYSSIVALVSEPFFHHKNYFTVWLRDNTNTHMCARTGDGEKACRGIGERLNYLP